MTAFKQREQQANKHLGWSVVLAVLLHMAIMPLLGFLVPNAQKRPDSRPIRLVSIPHHMLPKRQRTQVTPHDLAEKRKDKEAKKKQELEGQVVDVPPSPDDTPPDEYKYLSEHNTRTERESASRHASSSYQNAMNEMTRANQDKTSSRSEQQRSKAIEVGPEKPHAKRDEKTAGQETAFELPKIEQRDRLALELDPTLGIAKNQNYSEALRGNSRRLKLSLGDSKKRPERAGSAPKKGSPTVELVPKLGVLARISGAPANDHLDGLEEGEGTFLNSREFKFASFFNRMKRGVSQHWRPLREYRRRDPTGNVYGQRSRVTVLKVTLKPDGSLIDVEVTRSSGVDFLDSEAVAAFHRAEPFPNPPTGLVDSDSGNIDFPFGFHIEFSRHSGLRLPF